MRRAPSLSIAWAGKRRPQAEYPAIYISDGGAVLTLWQVQNQASCNEFNRRTNIGLHHLALSVRNREALDEL